MDKILPILIFCTLATAAEASWYWPFGDSEPEPPRLSELVERASELIGEASDLAADGKVTEAVGKYREALAEIDRVEAENPERAKTTEFATLKTKRAYVEATIDALLMNQARKDAKPVAVSDTTDLERRLAEERAGGAARAPVTPAPAAEPAKAEPSASTSRAKAKSAESVQRLPRRPLTPREEVMKAIGEGDFAKADRLIAALLAEKPNDAAALNLRAAKETAEGKYREAEKTLDTAIMSNPRDYFAFYNMAVLKLQTRSDDRDGARRYYETGRSLGGPRNESIEEMLK